MSAMMTQKTLAKPVTIAGVGLHTGRRCKAVLLPAPAGSGIAFARTDIPGRPIFPADFQHVVDVVRGTTLGTGDHRIYTIEHLLSVFCGLGIDNVTVEMDNTEPPVVDGSALPFAKALVEAGTVEQGAPKRVIAPAAPYEYRSHQTVIRVDPAESFSIDCEVHYDHPLIQTQTFHFDETMSYVDEVAPARTYCFDYEIEALKKKGLAKGGSLDNAIVIGGTGIYNPDSALRFSNEVVRHKVLDLMGDLTLLGARLQGRITAQRCGHGHNVKFLRGLWATLSTVSSAIAI